MLDDLGPDLLAQLLKDLYCCSPVRIGGRHMQMGYHRLAILQDTYVSKCHPRSAILGRGKNFYQTKTVPEKQPLDIKRRIPTGS